MPELRGAPRSGLFLIAAVARNGVIGVDNRLPWRLPEDLKRFKALTYGHAVIMGRRTWESLGKPLPGRRNLVVMAHAPAAQHRCEVFPDLAAALDACRGEDAFVIGGARLYAAALPLAERLYLTEIQADFGGDTLFPAFDRAAWREVSRERHRAGAGFDYDFVVYERAEH